MFVRFGESKAAKKAFKMLNKLAKENLAKFSSLLDLFLIDMVFEIFLVYISF